MPTAVVARLVVGFVLAGAALAAQRPQFRSTTQTVSLYATALGVDGRLVTDLTRDDFDVRDNGVAQTLTTFSDVRQPISIAVMLDMSSSMTGSLPLLRTGAAALFAELQAGDKARVGSFANRIIISTEFTNNRDDLIRALYTDLPQSGSTALWSAINVGMSALSKVDGRRVVLVFTDGYDTTHAAPTLDDVMRRSQVEQVMVYGIGLNSLNRSGLGQVDPPDPGLRRLAEESGGGYVELVSPDNLGPAFARVADELHRQYLIGFEMQAADGKLHTLEVRARRDGVTVRTRRSYLAAKGGGPEGDS